MEVDALQSRPNMASISTNENPKAKRESAFGWSGDSFIRNTFSHTASINRLIQVLWENKETGVPIEDLHEGSAEEDVLRAEYMGLIFNESGVERLDDRLEEYLGEMLVGIDSFEAGRYSEALVEAKRLIRDHIHAADETTRAALTKGVRKVMRQTRNRLERGIESLRNSVDLDFRASANLELKIIKLNHHRETAQRINESLESWRGFLSDNQFFRSTTDREIQQHWKTFGFLSDNVRQGLLVVCHTIQLYLNQAVRDYKRTRKLMHLNALINRHEHKTRSNIEEIAETCDGPIFSGIGSVMTAFDPSVIDHEPQVATDALSGKGLTGAPKNAERIINLNPLRHEESESRIDWEEVRAGFETQDMDLFRFLRDHLKIKGAPPTEKDLITGYITILQRTPELWRMHKKNETEGTWRFAVIHPTRKAQNE